MKADGKACPYCAETIKAAAIRCRYCQADLAADAAGLSAIDRSRERREEAASNAVALGFDAQHSDLYTSDIPEILHALVSRSLVAFDERTERYRLLETVRQYTREQLDVRRESATMRDRHLGFFAALGEEAEAGLTGSQQVRWMERLEADHENLRAALEWAVSAKQSHETGMDLAGGIWRFWASRGYVSEGRAAVEAALSTRDSAHPSPALARALKAAGNLARLQSDYASAAAHHEKSLQVSRELGDLNGVAASLGNLGLVHADRGDNGTAAAALEEALALWRELGEKWAISFTLSRLGLLASHECEYGSAQALLEESLAFAREIGDLHGTASALVNLAIVHYEQGDLDSARPLLEQSISMFRELGNLRELSGSLAHLGCVAYLEQEFAMARTLLIEALRGFASVGDRSGIAWTLEGLAATEAACSRRIRSSVIWGASERLREEIGIRHSPGEQRRYERDVASARKAVTDDAAFDAAWQQGRGMTIEQAIEFALS